MSWRYMHNIEGRRQGIRLIDAGEYFSEWGAAVGAEKVAGLRETDGSVHLCWGTVPWMLDICREAYDAAGLVGNGRQVAVLLVADLGEWWGMEGVEGAEELVAFANPVGNVRIIGDEMHIMLSTLESANLALECWWEGFESAVQAAGWYIEGDEGDGSQGYLYHESCVRCEKCHRDTSDEGPLLPSGLCAECDEEDSRADLSRGVGS